MAPFYGWGSTASRLEPLRGGLKVKVKVTNKKSCASDTTVQNK